MTHLKFTDQLLNPFPNNEELDDYLIQRAVFETRMETRMAHDYAVAMCSAGQMDTRNIPERACDLAEAMLAEMERRWKK